MSSYFYTVQELSEIFSRSEQSIYTWTRLGHIPKADDGRFDLVDIIKYFEGKVVSADAAQLKTQIAAIKLERDKIELEALRKTYLDRSKVVSEWTARAAEVRQGLLSLEMKVAAEVDVKNRNKVRGLVRKYAVELLQSYVRESEYTPKINEEKNNGTKQEKNTKPKSTGKPKPKPKK